MNWYKISQVQLSRSEVIKAVRSLGYLCLNLAKVNPIITGYVNKESETLNNTVNSLQNNQQALDSILPQIAKRIVTIYDYVTKNLPLSGIDPKSLQEINSGVLSSLAPLVQKWKSIRV